ncbi:hypothetical protein Tco_1561139 [Tanacetum coccineum]
MSQSPNPFLTATQLVHVNCQHDVASEKNQVDLINLPCSAAILKLPQATANNHAEFVEAPELETMIRFLNILGYVVPIRLAWQFYTKDIPQPWQTLGKVIM